MKANSTVKSSKSGNPVFSANLGFLWKELPFIERIYAAHKHGFEGVEFHDEAQDADPAALRQALDQTGLPVLSLNVRIGETSGCAAIPDLWQQARTDIDAAIKIAGFCDAKAIHVLAGKTNDTRARECFINTLTHAVSQSSQTILIEPICKQKVPGYFLYDLDQAVDILEQINSPRLKIMFDCYHINEQHGDVAGRFAATAHHIGHVQIASHPARAEPFPSNLDYSQLIPGFIKAGYEGAYGCEYTPVTNVEAGLTWRDTFL